MQVPDALSRVEEAPRLDSNAEESLNENDPHFKYETEEVGKISFINFANLCLEDDQGYIADTEEESNKPKSTVGRIDCNSISLITEKHEISNQTSHYIEEDIVYHKEKLTSSGIDCNSISQFSEINTLKGNSSFLLESSCDVDVSGVNFILQRHPIDLFDIGGNDCISTHVCTNKNKYVNFSDFSQKDNPVSILQRHPMDEIDISGNDCISIQTMNSSRAYGSEKNISSDDNKFVCSVETDDERIDFTRENIKHFQRRDETLLPIILYLENGTLPKLQKEARSLLLKVSDYSLIDDLLFHSRIAKSKRTQRMGQFQLVIPKQLIPKIIETFHQTPLAGHMGIQQTVDNISEHFYFQNLPSTVGNYVRSCHECQERKMTKAHTKSEILSYRTPSEPFQTWQVDLFGPFPITQMGNTYVFTAIDMFTKFLFTVSMPNSDSITVSHALFKLFCTFIVCDCLISDRGSEFISQCTEHLCKLLEVNQNFTPSFIHHCLGLCERTHRTLAERLTPFTKKGIQWDNLLDAITFSFNISPSDSTKYLPYEVVYGFRPKLPLPFQNSRLTLNHYMLITTAT